MNTENTVSLVKELETINSSNSKTNNRLAWMNFVVSIVFLTALFFSSLNPGSGNINILAKTIFFAFAML